MPRLTSNEKPLNPYRVVWDLMHTIDLDNAIVTHESAVPASTCRPSGSPPPPQLHRLGQVHQLGYSLGLAMGAKAAFPDKQVVNVMGDLAFSTVGWTSRLPSAATSPPSRW